MEQRIIKFRVWNEEDKNFSFFDLNDGVSPEGREVNQFCGLLDKNGKEIYEGDIIKIPDDYEEYGFFAGEIREVYFLDGCFRLKPKDEHVIKRGDRGATIEDDMGACEIIGNIYENPLKSQGEIK